MGLFKLKRKIFIFLLILSVLPFSIYAQDLDKFKGKVISEITLQGNLKFTLRKLKAFMIIEEGDIFTSEKIRREFKNIYDIGLFQDLVFYAELLEDDTVKLIIEVKELETIKEIILKGNNKLLSDEIKQDLNIKTGDYFSRSALNQAVKIIKNKYREEGFLTVRVQPNVKTYESVKEVVIEFLITEGTEIVVGTVSFIGNEKIESRKIKREMETKEDKWYREGIFSEEKFKADKERIINYYKTFGYINAKILKTSRNYRWRNPEKKEIRHINLTIELYEGDKYFFGPVTIKGNSLFTEEEIRSALLREEGDVFNQKIHEQDIQAISGLYQKSGYIFSRVTPIESVDEESHKISYVFDIYEGDKAHIEKIIISGNTKTKDYVVRRELMVEEGEIFNAEKVRESAQKLMQTGFYQNVIPVPKQGSVEGLMNLDVQIEEAQTGMVQAGMQYGTQSGFGLNFGLQKKNFLGRGQNMGTQVNIAQEQKTVSLNFLEPWFLGLPVSLGGSVSFNNDSSKKNYFNASTNYTTDDDGSITKNDNYIKDLPVYTDSRGNVVSNQDYFGYTENSLNFSVNFGYSFLDWHWIRTDFGIQRIWEYYRDFNSDNRVTQKEIFEANRFINVDGLKDDILNFNWGVSYSRNSLNHSLHPTKGYELKYNFNYTVGDWQLTKHHLKFQVFFNPFWKAALGYRYDVYTHADTWGGHYENEERNWYYFMQEELRGWDYDMVKGLYDYQFNISDGNLGRSKTKHTVEFRVPIAVDMVVGILYLDWGSISRGYLWKEVEPNQSGVRGQDGMNPWDVLWNPNSFMGAFGFGGGLNMQQLPIRLYYGWQFFYDYQGNKLSFWNYTPQNTETTIGNSSIPKGKFIFTIAGYF